jgi:hypothetical protein
MFNQGEHLIVISERPIECAWGDGFDVSHIVGLTIKPSG